MTYKTKGIVLKVISYGETSIIVHVFTEQFGLVQYIVKGIRKKTKFGNNKSAYFQVASLLNMEVYHHKFKNLQFIKDYDWFYRYNNMYFSILKNSVAIYMIELFHQAIKDGEQNELLYNMLESYLIFLDNSEDKVLANLPLFYSLKLLEIIGFQINNNFSSSKNILDLQEGIFVENPPAHNHYIVGLGAQVTAFIMQNLEHLCSSEALKINRTLRQELLQCYQVYFSLHVSGFKSLKSLPVLQSIL